MFFLFSHSFSPFFFIFYLYSKNLITNKRKKDSNKNLFLGSYHYLFFYFLFYLLFLGFHYSLVNIVCIYIYTASRLTVCIFFILCSSFVYFYHLTRFILFCQHFYLFSLMLLFSNRTNIVVQDLLNLQIFLSLLFQFVFYLLLFHLLFLYINHSLLFESTHQ